MALDTTQLFAGLGRDAGYVPQPYIPRVNFWIGGNDKDNGILLTGGYQAFSPTQFSFTLVSFEHVLENNAISQTFSISLFDPTWMDIESRLFEGGNRVRFSYEYVGPDGVARSPGGEGAGSIFEGHLIRWSPTLTMGGTLLAIEGISKYGAGRKERSGAYGGDYSDLSAEAKKIIDQVLAGDSGTFGGRSITPSDIATAIALARGWGIEEVAEDGTTRPTILPTEPVKATDSLNTTDSVGQLFQRGWATDMGFLRDLCKVSKSADGKNIAYDAWETHTPGGQTILHFEPYRPSDRVEPKRIFTFLYGYKNSEVISFNPNIQVEYLLSGPGVESKSVVYETTTKLITEFMATAAHGHKREGQAPTFYTVKPPGVDDADNIFEGAEGTSSFYRAVAATANSNGERNILYSIWYQNYLQSNTAELVIQGDPRFEVHDAIAVYVVLPPNYNGIQSEIGTIHPASGPYRIKKITHRIQAGGWVTVLELYRAGILIDKVDGDSFYNSPGGEHATGRDVPLHSEDPETYPEPGTAVDSGNRFAGAAAAAAAAKAPMAPIRCGEVGRGLQEGHKRSENLGPPYRHDGVDITTGGPVPIYAPQNGTVTKVFSGCKVGDKACGGGWGNHVEVTSADGSTVYRYAHLSEINVAQGKEVNGGHDLGRTGMTGRADGHHLHLEVLVGGKPVDPADHVILPTEACK